LLVDTLKNVFRIPDLRKKMLFTLLIMVIFRIAAHIPVPGVNLALLEQKFHGAGILNFLDLFSGGALRRFSVMAMGVNPYITASIIMQLLIVVIEPLKELAKEGVEGRKKISQYTRYGTVILGIIQATGMAIWLRSIVINPGVFSFVLIVLTLTAGTVLLMWLGELITARGIGNGVSLIIFAGIIARMPQSLFQIFQQIRTGQTNFFVAFLLLIVAIAAIAAVVFVQEGQRKIPVQYAKRVVGRKVYGGQSTHLPLKVNQAGVIPIIFASSVLMFPLTIAQFLSPNLSAKFSGWLGPSSIIYNLLYVLLIIFFTYFYTAMTFNPEEIADNMKKYGGFIPGLRPGRSTAEYINRVLVRISLAGAIYLAVIAVLPNIVIGFSNLQNAYLGGTALLIVVGVALDLVRQMEAHLLMRNYEGFMK